ncbi:hypothetical protein ACFQ21_10460 [Ohtaekwangia kribbensis]|uniref:Lipoprotein n=1 Tax=Ohtaekwangia kribbensis TaxID=688913 RepID=A0ABW3K3C8_9BACT
MTKTINLILFAFIAILMTSCSWAVNLVIANNSNEIIFVRYIIPPGSDENQFFENPKTYNYDNKLLKLYKLDKNKRPKDIPTDSRIIPEMKELEVRIAPGQAVHVGVYYSFQPREEIISKYNLKILTGKDSILTPTMVNSMFEHWGNIKTDLLEVKQ